jgi:hypothetical protein
MCTVENEHSVLVCDIAIQGVREAVSTAFGDSVQFTPAPGQGTRVEVAPTIDEETFQEVTRAAIVAAQQKNATQNPWAFQALYLIDKRRTISSSSFWTFYVLHHISAQAWTTSR